MIEPLKSETLKVREALTSPCCVSRGLGMDRLRARTALPAASAGPGLPASD